MKALIVLPVLVLVLLAGCSSGSVTKSEKVLQCDSEGNNPYKGKSVKELWELKPKISFKPYEIPAPGENEKMMQWRRALESAEPNPYEGKSARQLRKIKPKMKRCDHFLPDDEEAYRAWQWWFAMHNADSGAGLREPIEFYGVAVNQSNKPIAGVTVYVERLVPEGNLRDTILTDEKGCFSVTKVNGKSISLSVGKKGCRAFPPLVKSFEYFDVSQYDFHVPDSTNPVVFRLWEYSNPEPMYKSEIMPKRFPVNDKVVWLDLKGHVVDIGQVGFSVFRVDPTNVIAGFTISIHAAEGTGVKLAAEDDEMMFQAPEAGYEPSITIEQLAGHDCWTRTHLRFYVHTSDNKHAALQVELNQYNNGTAGMDGQIYYNPSGSRNLQFDYKKVLYDERIRKTGHDKH